MKPILAMIITVIMGVALIGAIGYSLSSSNYIYRVKVLENNTITWAKSSVDVYDTGDTVWVNLEDHFIDDTSNVTMKCVILENKK